MDEVLEEFSRFLSQITWGGKMKEIEASYTDEKGALVRITKDDIVKTSQQTKASPKRKCLCFSTCANTSG